MKGEVDDLPFFIDGNLSCDYLYSSAFNITVTGDATIKHAYYGEYPEGSIQIFGKTKVPFFLNSTHGSDFSLDDNTVTFGINDSGDFDFCEKDFPAILRPHVYNDDDGYLTIKIRPLVDTLKEGKSPFKNIDDKDFSLGFSKDSFLKTLAKKV